MSSYYASSLASAPAPSHLWGAQAVKTGMVVSEILGPADVRAALNL